MNEESNLLAWTESHHRTLARFQRYRTTNSNLLAKHRKAIEDYRKNRTIEAQKEEKMEMARDRHQLYQQRNEPGNLENNLEGYRRKAIELGLRPAEFVR